MLSLSLCITHTNVCSLAQDIRRTLLTLTKKYDLRRENRCRKLSIKYKAIPVLSGNPVYEQGLIHFTS